MVLIFSFSRGFIRYSIIKSWICFFQRRGEITHYLILFTLFSLIFLASCADNKPKLYPIERQYKTDGKGLAIFHPVAEQDGGLGLKFPGYLIGIEQTDRTIIGKPEDFENLNDANNDKNHTILKEILDRPQRTFISHVVEYSLEDDKKYIKEDVFYNIYDRRFGTETQHAYQRGIEALDELKKRIEATIDEEEEKKRKGEKEKGYTHLIFYSMGWNTDQQESLRNYNSLLYQMRKIYDSPEFIQDEFDQKLRVAGGGLTVETLCEMINNDYPDIKFNISDNTIDRLNELLKTPCFYKLAELQFNRKQQERLQQGLEDTESKKVIEKIKTVVEKTHDYRKKSFSELSDKEQDTIKQLNRELLEIMYPEIPKKKDYLERNPFQPLFVGISWPSERRFSSVWWFIGDLRSSLSYISKAKDADEIGVLWAERVLWDVLVPIKKKNKDIPLILMGHSLGARIITRAVFSRGIFDPKQTNAPQKDGKDGYDIDLVIGLEGAFSINRFISGKGKEGSPYSNFNKNKYVKKFIFTWSEHDWANPLAYWFTGEEHIGGMYGYAKSYVPQKKDKKDIEAPRNIFDHFEIEVEEERLHSYDVKLKKVKIEEEFKKKAVWCWWLWKITQGMLPKVIGDEWKQSFYHPEKISIVDASKLIENKPYGKGGIAHSDIYTPGIARFIWDCIDNSKKR